MKLSILVRYFYSAVAGLTITLFLPFLWLSEFTFLASKGSRCVVDLNDLYWEESLSSLPMGILYGLNELSMKEEITRSDANKFYSLFFSWFENSWE